MNSIRRTILTAAVLAPMLSGCLSYGSIDERAVTINKGLETAQNTAILLDLARASRSRPIYFESINVVHGVGQEDLKLGLPALTLGPKQMASQKQFVFGGNASNVLDSQIQTSFDVGVLNSKQFYAGMMAPLGLDEANLLFSEGYSRELVLYLLIDSLKVTEVTGFGPGEKESRGPTIVLYNDPSQPNYYDRDPSAPFSPSFERFIREAMTHGLKTEAFAPAASDSNEPTTTKAAGSAPGVTVMVVQPPETKPEGSGVHVRLCYDHALTTPDAMEDFADAQKAFPDENSECGSDSTAPRTQSTKVAVFLHHREFQLEVKFRSIFGIFNYLGGLIARDQQSAVQLRDYGIAAERLTPAPLLDITSASSGCFSQVRYDGRSFCVPANGADNTAKIFAILEALQALKTSPGDLPITQTVRITP